MKEMDSVYITQLIDMIDRAQDAITAEVIERFRVIRANLQNLRDSRIKQEAARSDQDIAREIAIQEGE